MQKMKLAPLLALCLGFFMVIMDVTIVNVAMPQIGISIHASVSWLEWIVDAYTLTFASLLLTAGHMGDQFGEKKLFLWGTVLFAIASLCCGLSNTPLVLTAFRFLQGIFAAFMVPASMALINSIYKDPGIRARALGIWAAVGGIAAATGPILGGILTTYFGWRAVFFVNIPIGAACFILTAKLVNVDIPQHFSKFDIKGQLSIMIAIAALAFGLIESGRLGWTDESVLISFAIAIVFLISFLFAEKSHENPMLPLEFFSNKYFSNALFVGFMINVSYYGILFVLPLYFEQVRNYSVFKTGFALSPLMLAMPVASYFTGKLVSRIGSKVPMLIGLFLGTLGFLGMLVAGKHSPMYWEFVIPFTITGFGLAGAMPATAVTIMRSVAEEKKGIAASAFNASRQIGSLVGVAMFGTIIVTSTSFITALHVSLLIAAGAVISSIIATAILL